MKNTRFAQMKDQIVQNFSAEQGQRIAQRMEKEYHDLCLSSADCPKALESHTHKNIFPVAAAFYAMLEEGINRNEAIKIARDSFLTLMEAPEKTIRKALKIPFLYRIMPRLWKTLMPRMFSEDAGFQFRFYPTDSHQVKFDMLSCPYYQICKELDCLELADIFCTTDDICYGHMHPKLIWKRTKTIARGGELCDFDLYIPQKSHKK